MFYHKVRIILQEKQLGVPFCPPCEKHPWPVPVCLSRGLFTPSSQLCPARLTWVDFKDLDLGLWLGSAKGKHQGALQGGESEPREFCLSSQDTDNCFLPLTL